MFNVMYQVFNRPGVAGAVLQTPLLKINSLGESVRSGATCHMSRVTCNYFLFFLHLLELVVGASDINGAHPV